MGISLQTHLKGLPYTARRFLLKNAKKVSSNPTDKKVSFVKSGLNEFVGVMSDIELRSYELLDGSEATELEQLSVWNDGPVLFLALKKPNGEVLKWSPSDIEKALESC